MKEARPCVEVGVSLVVSSHGFLLQEIQEAQETGPVTLGTGESWPALRELLLAAVSTFLLPPPPMRGQHGVT